MRLVKSQRNCYQYWILFYEGSVTVIFLWGGLLIIATMDHTQLQPVQGRPFLLSSHVITCFKMVMLKTSVRASGDVQFQRLQAIARMHYMEYEEDPSLLDEFKNLLPETCTFVDSWSSPEITPSTYRLYGRRSPANDATNQFVSVVRQSITSCDLRERQSDDVEKSRYSHSEWSHASISTKNALDKNLKEPRTLLFFCGAVYEFTYNKEGQFSQSQMAILIELPLQDDLDRHKKINILAAPPGIHDIEFDPTMVKEEYLIKGFKEVKVGLAPETTQSIGRNIQAERKQYGLKHRVTSTIHAAMGDTLVRVAIEVQRNNPNYKLWDKAQAIVALSRTKLGKNVIFVGDKNETILSLVDLIKRKSHWTDYMEQVLRLITLNLDEIDIVRTMTQNTFPFRICDITLPQCNTGFVYFLISIRRQNYAYIGQTICLRNRIQQHNSGSGASSTEPSYLRPFAVMAYICGFDGRRPLREYIERKWKERRDELIMSGIEDPKQWARCGADVISSVNEHDFNIEKSDLRLVLLFTD